MEYDLRHANPGDKEWGYQLYRRCFRDILIRQFGVWHELWQRNYFEKKWDPSKYQIVVSEGQDVGLVSVRVEEDHIFLVEIQIDPEFQNRGLGTRILRDLIAEAEARGLPLRLRVLHQNRAKNLYSRLGFSRTGETHTHILMEKILTDNRRDT